MFGICTLSHTAQIPPAWWQRSGTAEWERRPDSVKSPAITLGSFRENFQNTFCVKALYRRKRWTTKIKRQAQSKTKTTKKVLLSSFLHKDVCEFYKKKISLLILILQSSYICEHQPVICVSIMEQKHMWHNLNIVMKGDLWVKMWCLYPSACCPHLCRQKDKSTRWSSYFCFCLFVKNLIAFPPRKNEVGINKLLKRTNLNIWNALKRQKQWATDTLHSGSCSVMETHGMMLPVLNFVWNSAVVSQQRFSNFYNCERRRLCSLALRGLPLYV